MMDDHPALAVLTVPGALRERGPRQGAELAVGRGPELSVGLRVPLTERFVIGRSREADLTLDWAGVQREHCVVERRYGRWWLLDLGASTGSFHNGVRVASAQLEHLDVIDIPPGVTLRFLERPTSEFTDAAMEGALAAAPDDARRWAVYADWLQEHGAPMGERIARPNAAHDGRWLGALATAWGRGDAEVDWAFGMARGVVLRRLARAPAPLLPRSLLALVVSDPNFRFLRTLELDVESLILAHDWDEALAAGLDVLTRAPLAMLETLRVGPLSSAPVAPRTLARLEALRARCPALRTDAASLFTRTGAARLQVLACPAAVSTVPAPGGWVALSDVGTLGVGARSDSAICVQAPEGHPASQVAVRLAPSDGRWWVEDVFARVRPYRHQEFALRVNEREVVEACLRSGDTLELCPGLLLRFTG